MCGNEHSRPKFRKKKTNRKQTKTTLRSPSGHIFQKSRAQEPNLRASPQGIGRELVSLVLEGREHLKSRYISLENSRAKSLLTLRLKDVSFYLPGKPELHVRDRKDDEIEKIRTRDEQTNDGRRPLQIRGTYFHSALNHCHCC